MTSVEHTLPTLSRIVFGDADPPRLPAAWILATTITIHLAVAAIAWFPGIGSRSTPTRSTTVPFQIERLIEIEMPKPAPAPIPVPVPEAPPPAVVEKIAPAPVPVKRPATVPVKARTRMKAPAAPAEPAAAAQVVTRNETSGDAGANAFDVVNGKSAEYAGGVTSSTGTSQKAVPEVVVQYDKALLEWIERHKRYPRDALRRRIEGRPFVQLRIDRAGSLLDYQLITSSGHPELDRAAEEMVRRAEPFPALPEDYPGSTFRYRFGVDFNLRRQ